MRSWRATSGAGIEGLIMLAELVVLPESALVHIPPHLSFSEAATPMTI